MAGVVHVPWYATGFRGDKLADALAEIAPVALRYGATDYDVYRSRDDRYKFLMTVVFDDKSGWDAFWFGAEFTDMRTACSSWFTVPLLYSWHDQVAAGELKREPALVADDELD